MNAQKRTKKAQMAQNPSDPHQARHLQECIHNAIPDSRTWCLEQIDQVRHHFKAIGTLMAILEHHIADHIVETETN